MRRRATLIYTFADDYYASMTCATYLRHDADADAATRAMPRHTLLLLMPPPPRCHAIRYFFALRLSPPPSCACAATRCLHDFRRLPLLLSCFRYAFMR